MSAGAINLHPLPVFAPDRQQLPLTDLLLFLETSSQSSLMN
jgi:hypothetical protein